MGSTGVYLSMRARLPRISRETIDRAAMDGVDVIEVPGAHARPAVLVPRDEMALALRLHWASYAKHAAPLFASGRYSETALKAIASQVCRVLDEGPLSTADIRAVVTHPEAGELLTGALIDLAVRGIVRRHPADGRLDSSKYLYELRHPDDRPDLDAEGDAATVMLKATRLFLQRYGPAAVDEIADWGGLTKGSIRKGGSIRLAEVHLYEAYGVGRIGSAGRAPVRRHNARSRHVYDGPADPPLHRNTHVLPAGSTRRANRSGQRAEGRIASGRHFGRRAINAARARRRPMHACTPTARRLNDEQRIAAVLTDIRRESPDDGSPTIGWKWKDAGPRPQS